MSAFDEMVSDMDGAMVLVTTSTGHEPSGCLVGFHGQCSIDPPQYVVWLSVSNHTYPIACAAGHVAVHLLGRDDRDLAQLFGGATGDEVDKFAALDWREGPGGTPLLQRCPHRFVLEQVALVDSGGDHHGFVGRPVVADRPTELAPLRLAAVADIEAGHPPDDTHGVSRRGERG